MAKNRNREIWETGYWLSAAWIEFARTEQRDNFETALDGTTIFAMEMENASTTAEVFSGIQKSISAAAARMTKIRELRKQLLSALFANRLIALGYREWPSTSAAPVKIDPDFFENPDIIWDENWAEAYGKRYGRIRVIDPQCIPEFSKPQKGRPGSGESIISTIDRLIRANPNFCYLPRKTACDQIRELIGKPNIKGNGLSDINLSKHIVKMCPKRQLKL